MVLFLMNTNWAQKCQPFFSERIPLKYQMLTEELTSLVMFL